MAVRIKSKGHYDKALKYLAEIKNPFHKLLLKKWLLDKYGEEGVRALQEATPVDTGLTRDSWYYRIVEDESHNLLGIEFCNSNVVDANYTTRNKNGSIGTRQYSVQVAILLQYGHGTRNGGWVEGRDYINPAIQPIFDKIAKDAWEEITR